MKKQSIISMTVVVLLTFGLLVPAFTNAQESKKEEKKEEKQEKIMDDSKDAKAQFIKGDASMANLFKHAYGYVVFPNIGKGAAGVGAAAGHGTVYEKGKSIGTAHMTQLSVGAQAGGAAYREVIFFESKAAFDRFKDNKIEFTAQTSAVAVKSGASASANYRDGVVVFTQPRAGLLVDASLGGQKFKYTAL